jgi:hypothetical protein
VTQHLFETLHNDRPIEISMGWEPRTGLYLQVSYQDALDRALSSNEVSSRFLWTSGNVSKMRTLSVDDIQEQLDQLGVEYPSQMLGRLRDDLIEQNHWLITRFEDEGDYDILLD